MTIWTISIDWDRNGDYAGTYDDVTSRVLQANWFLGMRKPYQEMAHNSMCVIVLSNADRRFSPDYATSPLHGKILPQRPIRIQSNDGTDTRTHWLGWIEAVEPVVNKYGQRVTKILASGPLPYYKAAETKLALQEDKRTDEIIGELLKEVVIPPALSRAWILDRSGNSEVGETTYLADVTAYSKLDIGQLTLGMAGDNWIREAGFNSLSQDNYDVYRAIGDITAAEHGKFMFSRDGKAEFWNRHHLLHEGTLKATFDDTMTEMTYTHAGLDYLKNDVIVVCHPRKVSDTSDNVLWELGDSVIRVEKDKPRPLYVKFEDESGNRIGAKEVTVTDLEFEGHGTATAMATATVEAKANGAEITFISTTGAVVTKCVVKGRKIIDSGQIEAKAIDVGSIVDYGRRTLRINLPSIDNIEQAQYIADFERDRRKDPVGMTHSITVLSHGKKGGGQHTQQLALTLGDLVRAKETQTAHDAKYHVIGEAHELTHGATLWKTTWYVEPAPTVYPWELGVSGHSNLGISTRLTY